MKKRIAAILSLTGVGCFFFLIYHLHPQNILRVIRRLSLSAFLCLLLLRCAYWVLKTGCWWIILNAYDRRAAFGTLFAANLSGNSIAYLTPPGRIGGELMRFIRVEKVEKKTLLASVMVDKTLEWLSGCLLICIALMLAFRRNTLGPGNLLLAFGAILGAVILLLLFAGRPGMIPWIYAGISRVLPKRNPLRRHGDKVREMESLVLRFHARHPRRFFAVFLLYLLKGLFWALEIHLTFKMLGATKMGFFISFLLVTMGSVSFLFPSLPGGMGVYEGTYISLFMLLKIPMESGVGLVITRRVIGLAWAGVGLMLLFSAKKNPGNQGDS